MDEVVGWDDDRLHEEDVELEKSSVNKVGGDGEGLQVLSVLEVFIFIFLTPISRASRILC